MSLPTAILMRLGVETRGHEPDADAPWLGLLAMTVTRAHYLDHLVLVYGFEAPIEAAFALTPRVETVVQLRERARSGLLVQDLLALGLTPKRIANLPQCASIVPFRDPIEVLGWMYVIDRTTHLHEPVRSHLERMLHPMSAFSYVRASDGVVDARRQELGETLERVVDRPELFDRLLGAAHAAFACQRAWFTGPSPAARS